VGLGIMGAAMAGNLLEAGHELVVHNRTRNKAERLARRVRRRFTEGGCKE
jgi:3-hydroxyisobutyrate dehydrogenase-like beta-hydroxyacid dehydrogenase